MSKFACSPFSYGVNKMDVILVGVIRAKIEKEPYNYEAYEDLFSVARNALTTDKKEALRLSAELRSICEKHIRLLDGTIIPRLISLIDRTLLFEAPHVFDSYIHLRQTALLGRTNGRAMKQYGNMVLRKTATPF